MFRAIALSALLACAAPLAAQEAPAPPQLEFVFEEVVLLTEGWDFGETPLGGRFVIPITGGTFEGPRLKGEVLPGGWDWQVIRDDGCRVLKADYFLRTDDGVPLHVVNTGTLCPPAEGEAPGPIVTHPVIEAPKGEYEWLNRAMFLGTVVPETVEGQPAVRIRIYRAR